MYRLGITSFRRRGLVVVVWLIVAVAVIGAASTMGGSFSDNLVVPDSQSQQAGDLLEERFPAAAGGSAQLVFQAPEGTLTEPPAAEAIERALDDVRSQPHVATVGELRLSSDSRIGYVVVEYREPTPQIRDDAFERLTATAARATADGVRMELGGELPVAAEAAPAGQEVIGLAVAALVLLLAFGSVIAMGLPIGIALVGLTTSVGFITAVAALTEVSDIAVVLSSMIGLGVGIDYALFIVTRYREHLHAGVSAEESAGRAISSAGAAVLFAGLTVVIAICGLAIFGLPALTTVALLTAFTVAVMVALSLTLLPALLGFAGHRIDALRIPGLGRRDASVGVEMFWHRFGRRVCARPWAWLLGALTLLFVLALPLLDIRLGVPSAGTNASSMTTRQAHDLTTEAFGPGFSGPLLVAVELDDGPGADRTLTTLASAISADPGVDWVSPPRISPDGTVAVLTAIPTAAPGDEATTELVHRLRDDLIPSALEGIGVRAYVSGQTATTIDQTDRIASRLVWFILIVIGLSVVLLTMVFRSIAVPIKAAAMNLLSIGAAYGVVVAVFQWGWLGDVFGVQQTLPIASFIPMLMFAVLFGLSMDYEVFLLSRVREEYVRHGDNDRAVIDGIASTARVITAAALIMISVFLAFVLGEDPFAKMLGLGLATAVLVDATIVRVVLVPATMRLLGDRNWWLPRCLDRILPRIDVIGTSRDADLEH